MYRESKSDVDAASKSDSASRRLFGPLRGQKSQLLSIDRAESDSKRLRHVGHRDHLVGGQPKQPEIGAFVVVIVNVESFGGLIVGKEARNEMLRTHKKTTSKFEWPRFFSYDKRGVNGDRTVT